MPAIRCAETPPARREELDATERVNRIIVKCILSPAAHIHCRSHFADYLYMLIQDKLEAQSREQFIRPIQQHRIVHWFALRIAVEYVAQVCTHIYVLTEPPAHTSNQPKVTPISSCSRTTLHHIQLPKTVGFVLIPAVERNDAGAKR